MRHAFCLVALAFACAGCVSEAPEPVFSAVNMTPEANNPNCRDYTAEATVNGEQQPIVGRACLQSDGTWQIVEGTPQNPNQTVMVYPPYYPDYSYYYPYYPYYAGYYDPWYWGPPIGVSVGAGFFFGGHGHHGHGGHHGGGGWGHGHAGGGGGHHG